MKKLLISMGVAAIALGITVSVSLLVMWSAVNHPWWMSFGLLFGVVFVLSTALVFYTIKAWEETY